MGKASVDSTQNMLPHLDLGQNNVEGFLDSCLQKGHVPPLLFTGPEGTGKEYTAIDFARRLACSNEPVCRPGMDPCASCRGTMRLEHPAIHLVYPTPAQGGGEGDEDDVKDLNKILEEKRRDIFSSHRFPRKTSIRIAKARAIIRRAHTKPFNAPYNIFIIIDAHTMREEAQNALLKLVEEPPPHSILFLITPNSDAILYTIRSRCQRLRFAPLKAPVIEKILGEYYKVGDSVAHQAAALSRGSIKHAKEIASSYDDKSRKAAAELAKGVLDEPDSWLIRRALGLSRGSNRDEVALFLHELQLYFRDIMTGTEEIYFNVDSKQQINALKSRWVIKKLPAVVEMIGEARDKILRRNMNIDATLANLFLAIKRSG